MKACGRYVRAGEGDINSIAIPEVVTVRCTGCGRCVAVCSERLFTLEVSGFRKHAATTAPQRCTQCLKCLLACPVGALGSVEPGASGGGKVGVIGEAEKD
jgi:ferredoxin